MADDQNSDGEKQGWSGADYGALITAVGGVTIGAFSAVSGNKRAWEALKEKAKLSEQQNDFQNNLALLQNYEDMYFKMAAPSEAQLAKQKVLLYSNIAGFVVISIAILGAVYLVSKI